MLNLQHPHLKFAVQKETVSLSFLDVQIKIFGNGFEHTLYRKQSNASLILNHANCPKSWKSDVTTCLLHRAKFVYLNVMLSSVEVKNLRKMAPITSLL